MTDHYDVIIIGTGVGGGTLAYKLAGLGKRILLLERGDFSGAKKRIGTRLPSLQKTNKPRWNAGTIVKGKCSSRASIITWVETPSSLVQCSSA